MSHTPMKKSVFDRIERGGGNSSPSSGTTNTNHKSTHGFCNTYIKTGACPLGDACKFIHEQPNLDKQPGAKDEFRITKTITRVVDMSSPSIKSTVTVSHEQRSVSNSNSIPSSRTVVEGGTISNEQSDRRLSSSDRKQSQSRTSDSKRKSSSNSNESSKKKNRSSNKNKRSNESSASDSDYNHSSYKRKKQSDIHSTSSKYKTHDSISPQHDEDVILSDQLIRQTQSNNKSPKRTIVITDRKKDENNKRTNKDNKTNPDIEFLGSKIINRDKKSIETIHQQAESNKKSLDIKRERKSPNKSSSDQQKRHSSSSTSNNEKNIQIKIDDTKHQSNKTQNSSEHSERSAPQLTPPVVQLSPTPSVTATSEIFEKGSVVLSNEPEKTTPVQPPSPICVILDDDSSPAPSIDKKVVRQTSTTPVKRTNDNDKNNSKQSKQSRDSDKSRNKEKTNENTEIKRKRLNDVGSRKVTSNRKSENDNRSTNNRSDSRRSTNTSSRDDTSSRKYKEKSESKTSKSNDSKDRNLPASSSFSSSKPRSTNDRLVQLSPTPSVTATSEIFEKGSVVLSNEPEKTTPVQPPSPICVILDDDSSPAPSIDKKVVRQTSTTPVKRTNDNDKNNSKQSKQSRDSDKSRNKEKTNENTETKRKRLNDAGSRKVTSNRKSENDNRSTNNRSDSRRSTNTSSRDDTSSRKYKEKSESKTSKSNDSKDRNLPTSSSFSSSKPRSTNDRRDTTRSSSEKKRSTHRRGKEKGLENVTDSEEHVDEPVVPKQAALEAYMSMDWSLLSRDKRIPLNTQITSRIARIDHSINSLGVSERLLTNEQKEKLNDIEFQSLPLTHFMKQLQTKSSSQIINSCHRRFGSCAKDMIDMRHKWLIKSIEPVQQYEFINKEHYIAFQHAINSLLDKTPNDTPTVQIETTTADVLLS
ncbi:unnamed protein product [Rotaria sp. Silwood1]|nr:unnamed protein product [Rotaria sp. Silwood1]